MTMRNNTASGGRQLRNLTETSSKSNGGKKISYQHEKASKSAWYEEGESYRNAEGVT